MRERVGSYAATKRDQQRVLRFRMKRERQISEQTHVALIPRIRRRHRESVGHQTVVVRLTEKITSKQLPGSSFAFDFFDEMLFLRLEQFSRVREMRFVAMKRKQRDAGNNKKTQDDQGRTFPIICPGD